MRRQKEKKDSEPGIGSFCGSPKRSGVWIQSKAVIVTEWIAEFEGNGI
jgi:hypothetical protein